MTEKFVLGSLEFEDNSAAAVQAAQRNLDSLRTSVEGAATATEDLETNQLGLLTAFERIERKIDPVARAQQQYEKDLKKVEAAIEAQAVSHDRGAKAIENLEGRLQRAKDRAEQYSSSSREAAEAQARQERETEQLARSMLALENRLDPAAAAQRRFEDESNDVREALRRQVIESDKAADMLVRLEREYKEGGRAADTFERKTRGASGAMRLIAGAIAGLSIGLMAREVVSYADAWAAAENRLRLVTDSTEELREVQAGLYDISQDNFAAFGATADLYNRLSIGTERLSITQERLLGLTDTVAKSIAISGSSAQAAEAAIVQFGQALSGDFKGASQELNSIIEQTPGLARAIAQGLGVATGELKKLAKEGKLSTEVVIEALEKVAPAVDKQFGTLDPTLAQIGVTAKNAAMQISDAFAEPLLEEFKTDLKGLVAYLESEETLNAARSFGNFLANITANARLALEIQALRNRSQGGDGGLLERIAAEAAATRELREAERDRLAFAETLEGKLVNTNNLLVAQVDLQRQIRDREDENLPTGLNDQVRLNNLAADAAEREKTARADIAKLVAEGNRQLRESGERPFFLPDLGYDELVAHLRASREELDPLTAAILNTNDAIKKTGESAAGAGEELKKAFDFAPLKLEEAQLRAQIEAVRLGESQVAALEREQKIETEILRIKASGKTFDEDALRSQLEKNDALQAELALEQRRADRKLETEELEKLVAAARLGEVQLELARDRLEIEREIAELKVLAETAGADFDEAEERKAIERRNAVADELAYLENGFRGATRGFDSDLARVVDSFVDDLVENGADAFENLADFAWRSFKQVLLAPLKQALTGLLQGLFSGGGFNLGGGIPIPGGGTAAQAAGAGGLQQIIGGLAPAAIGGVGGLAAGQGVSSLLGLKKGSVGRGLVTGAVGGAVGGTLAGTLALTAVGASIGTAVGVGAATLGPIGAAIGLIVGGVLALLKGKPSDKTAQGVFNPLTGAVAGKADDKAPEHAKVRDEIMSAISEATLALGDVLGSSDLRNNPSTPANEAFLNVKVVADRWTGEPSIRVGYQGANGEPSGGGSFAATEEGAQQAVNKGIALAIDSMRGADDVLAPVAKALLAAGEPVQDIVAQLGELKTALGSNDDELSQWVQRINQVNDTFDPLIEKTHALGAAASAATRELEAANQEALRRIGRDFDKETRELSLGITSPLQLTAENLLEEQMQRLKDAEAVSLNAAEAQRRVNEVMALNAVQWGEFLDQAATTPEALQQLAEAIAAVAEQARAAGADTAMLEEQLGQARAAFAEEFDKQSRDLLLNIVNAPLARFEAMLEQQRARINTAAALGGDVRLAQEVAGAQREQFFSSLSDEDRLLLADFLGLIEDYTGRMGVVITQTRDLFGSQRNAQAEALKAAEDLADAWSNSAASIKDALRAAEERFGGRTLSDNLDAAQARFDDLLNRLTIGDQSAAGEIPDAGTRLLELIQQGFGTTPEGIARTEAALEGLRRADALAGGYANAAQSEAERIRKDDERLEAIEKALQAPDLSLPFLQQQVGLLDTSTSQGAQIVSLLTEYLTLAAAQASAAGLQTGAVQAAAEQYLGAASITPVGVNPAQLTEISPTAEIAAAAQTAQTAAGNRDLELAQTQLLTETAASTRATRLSIEDFLARAANADGFNDLTLSRIEAASRATPAAVQSMEATLRATSSDQVTAMAGLALVMQTKYDAMIGILTDSRNYLSDIQTDMRKVRQALVTS